MCSNRCSGTHKERTRFRELWNTQMKTDLLTLDPTLMQKLAAQPSNAMHRTPQQMRELQTKREVAVKDANAVSREQRRRDVTIKMLKANEDPLRKLRKLDTHNYFVVPYEMAKGVRAMIHRESYLNDRCYTTVKFKWGQRHYLKVKRVPEQGDM